MTDVEIAVRYAFAWLVGKARRVAGRADMEVDRGLDARMDRLHELISVKLGDDPALQRAQEEAGAGLEEPSQRTRQRLELALEDAAEHDAGFAAALARVVAELQTAGPVDTAACTGSSRATAGGTASTGVVRPGGVGNGTATAQHTGDATGTVSAAGRAPVSTTADRPDDETGCAAHRCGLGLKGSVPEMSAADTGSARAADGGTAGRRDGGDRLPGARCGGPDSLAMVSAQVCGTGDAIANGPHSVAGSGNLTVVERRARQEPAAWPPASPHGRTLVTTRRRDAALTGDGRRLVEVGLFSRAEAVAYLGGVLASHGRAEPSSQLAALADDLGCLPLALSQAANYLADAHLTCVDYRGLLADRATSLADAAPMRCLTTRASPSPRLGHCPSTVPMPSAPPAWPGPCSTWPPSSTPTASPKSF
ncbi:hypothetical protein [Streptomyces sp. CdTB01]|uniref:hypothetical protein n=1 Tax=Streptomyces sp. CdTB01 TaxID=1725411 RepID=UPI00131EEB31|nr:hypothetical protein [Streptomyces sp. CdTB01]